MKSHRRQSPVRPMLGTTVLFMLLLLLVAGVKSYSDLARARQRKHVLEERIRATHEHIKGLKERIELLRSDPDTLERLAREDLGLIKPGEVVIVLPEEEESRVGSLESRAE